MWNCSCRFVATGFGKARLFTLTRQCFSTTLDPSQSTSALQQKKVISTCQTLHSSIMDLNESVRGPLAPQSDRGTALPFVLCVGNHSSGKSSFINYVLGRNVQTAGVAPTDDSFSIIAPGPVDRDQDGLAVTSDPDLGFASLSAFGPTLQHHTVLKIRQDINSDFIMVDSPGMIDAPANYAGMIQQSSHTNQMDRGYDFTGVVRWLANSADIVCLFFDPDKPGTTGETLSVLLHALSGMDHKLLIILNKADQFERIHDFARAYGSLCWNLSKVIPRKDLPKIYTMCLPTPENTQNTIPSSLADLYTARDEVVQLVRKAPERRLDNQITSLGDAIQQLHMHCTILKDIQSRWSKLYWNNKLTELGVGSLGVALFGALSYYTSWPELTGAVLASTVLSVGGLYWYHSQLLTEFEKRLSHPEELATIFQRTHNRAILDGDESVAAVWQRIRENLGTVLMHELGNLHKIDHADLERLQKILKVDIPNLRRSVSPDHYGKDPTVP